MSDHIRELLQRNLQEVFGEGNAMRRRAAIEELYTTLLHGSAAGQVSPLHPLSCEANVLRPSKLQHAVQRRDSNGRLGLLPPFGPRA